MAVCDGAVTFTVRCTVHVLPGFILLFSLQTTGPEAPTTGWVQVPRPGVPEISMAENVVPVGTAVVRTSYSAGFVPVFQTLKV